MNEKKQLIEYVIQDIVEMISKDQHIEYDDAMNLFYESEVFDKLQDVETGLYLVASSTEKGCRRTSFFCTQYRIISRCSMVN